jgi:hypothetical protein
MISCVQDFKFYSKIWDVTGGLKEELRVAVGALGRAGGSGDRGRLQKKREVVEEGDNGWGPPVYEGKEKRGIPLRVCPGGPGPFHLLGRICSQGPLFNFEIFSSFLFCFSDLLYFFCILIQNYNKSTCLSFSNTEVSAKQQGTSPQDKISFQENFIILTNRLYLHNAE